MSKKAQGISINVIIVAIIALLVLVVLTVIFGGRMGLWNNELDTRTNNNCADLDDSIITSAAENCPEGYVASFSNYKDVNAGMKCCVALYN